MSRLQHYVYGQNYVRVVMFNDEPYFVAADVVDILGVGRVHDAMRGLDEDEKGADIIRTPGGDQQVSIVTEAGLYSLILRSRKPEAKAFKRWITHEVLPQIRKTGGYSQAPAVEPPSYAEALRGWAAEIEAREVAETQVQELAEPAAAWEHLASADGDWSVGDAAKVLSRDPSISIGQNQLFTRLGQLGWTYRQKSDTRWRAYQDAVNKGRLSEKAAAPRYDQHTGDPLTIPPQVRVTPKGLGELHHKLGGTAPLALTEQPQLALVVGED